MFSLALISAIHDGEVDTGAGHVVCASHVRTRGVVGRVGRKQTKSSCYGETNGRLLAGNSEQRKWLGCCEPQILGKSACNLVAGAGFEPATFGL